MHIIIRNVNVLKIAGTLILLKKNWYSICQFGRTSASGLALVKLMAAKIYFVGIVHHKLFLNTYHTHIHTHTYIHTHTHITHTHTTHTNCSVLLHYIYMY